MIFGDLNQRVLNNDAMSFYFIIVQTIYIDGTIEKYSLILNSFRNDLSQSLFESLLAG